MTSFIFLSPRERIKVRGSPFSRFKTDQWQFETARKSVALSMMAAAFDMKLRERFL